MYLVEYLPTSTCPILFCRCRACKYIPYCYPFFPLTVTLHKRKFSEDSLDPADTKTSMTGILFCTCSSRHLNFTFKLDYTILFFLQIKDLPIVQSQNVERNLQERTPVKTKLALRLPQQVCLKQGYKIDLEWSCDVPGAHTHHLPCSSVYVDVEVF